MKSVRAQPSFPLMTEKPVDAKKFSGIFFKSPKCR